jgi:hypothetical protein
MDTYGKAREARDKALQSGNHHDWLSAWAEQAEAERVKLEMSPAKEFYPKELHGKPAAGVLPEERPRRTQRRKGRCNMGKKDGKDGTKPEGVEKVKKTRATGIELNRKRLKVWVDATNRFVATKTTEIDKEHYDATWKFMTDMMVKAKATMDAARNPKAAAEEKPIALPI